MRQTTSRQNQVAKRKARKPESPEPADLRIIGGKFRGSKLRYHGDVITKPMKHRVREAIFNLLTTESMGHHAIDLFAGTGALGLEALSRGATSATFIEKHVPTARIIEENIAALGVEDRTSLLVTSAFLWGKRDLPKVESGKPKADELREDSPAFHSPLSALPWLVFSSPPYAFYVERQTDMLELIDSVRQHAPAGSVLVVEADERFDFATLSETGATWDIRTYPPAVVGLWRK